MNGEKLTLWQKAADLVTKVVGSWWFLLSQTIFLSCWITINVLVIKYRWDPYPFVFLNLIVGFQAAYTAPIILMSQNRESERERKKAALDLATDKKAEREITEIRELLNKLERNKLDKILAILEKK